MIEELKGYCSDCRISTSRNPQQCDSADKCVVAEYAKILEQSSNGKIKTPEDIVPSVELCRKLPKEYFKESVLFGTMMMRNTSQNQKTITNISN